MCSRPDFFFQFPAGGYYEFYPLFHKNYTIRRKSERKQKFHRTESEGCVLYLLKSEVFEAKKLATEPFLKWLKWRQLLED